MIRYSSWNGWRVLLRIGNQIQASSSSAPVVGLHPTPCSESTDKVLVEQSVKTSGVKAESQQDTNITSTPEPNSKTDTVGTTKRSSMVAAAFASLKKDDPPKKKMSAIDERMTSANSVEDLLSMAEAPQVSRRHALRIVSQLADWTTNKKIKLSDFEADPRFIKLCRLLGRGLSQGSNNAEKDSAGFGDLAVVLGITGDDEAVKLVSGVSMRQMIKIMSTLAQKQRRSTPLLRSLAFNLARQSEKINIKECADLLYAMAVLNFPDELLLDKICTDLCESVPANQKPAVIGSILTSLGLLKYKNIDTLDVLADWVAHHIEICRPQDITSLLLTLASVCHVPDKANTLFEIILPHVTMEDAPNPAAWLDIVWSLVVLNIASQKQVASVLDPDFHPKLVVNIDDKPGISIASKLKLLNINAAAQLQLSGYKGPLLAHDSDVRNVPLVRSREKQLLVASIMDSFSNLLPSATYLKTNVNTGMGFLIDGECMLDSKCNPLPVEGGLGEEVNKQSPPPLKKIPQQSKSVSDAKPKLPVKGTRIGILAWDYRDLCRGSPEPTGVMSLNMRLLEKEGYKILSIPYTEYNPRDKLVNRVQYLDRRLKSIVKGS